LTAQVLVTGGSGFLGRHVIALLVERGYDVVALARSTDAARAVEASGATAIAAEAARSSRRVIAISWFPEF